MHNKIDEAMAEIDNMLPEIKAVFEPKKKKKENPIIGKNSVKMNYSPFEDVPTGHRRCGKCGEIFPLEEFKKVKKLSYFWKCKKCNKFDKTRL